MLFQEFVEGTGCRETEKNYKIYKELEIIYMNTDCSKEHIYEMGRKLVDNSKTEKELRIEAVVKSQIGHHENEIAKYKEWIEDAETKLIYWKEDGDKDMIKCYRDNIKFFKNNIKWERNRINELKWVLS